MLWNIISLVIGILGIILSIIIWYVTKKKCHLTYYQSSSTLITKLNDDFYEDIDIKFRGHQIDKLTSTIFKVWNSGNIAIKQTDIAPKAPLQIQCNSKVLTARITEKTRPNCGILIEDPKNANLVKFNFDFLNGGDEFVCEVIHDGENNDLILSGEIIGETRKLRLAKEIDRTGLNSALFTFLFSMLISCGVTTALIFGYLKGMTSIPDDSQELLIEQTLIFGFVILYLLIFLFSFKKFFKLIKGKIVIRLFD